MTLSQLGVIPFLPENWIALEESIQGIFFTVPL
jgi:hypothetical protein